MADLEDVFKTVFKELKRRKPPPDYTEVIDFTEQTSKERIVPYIRKHVRDNLHCCICDDLGLKQHNLWKAYSVCDVPGLIFVCNPFTPAGQRFWIKQCIEKYPLPPSATNVGDATELWPSYCQNKSTGKTDFLKLRWATLGYHHDWDTKQYSETKQSPFPPCLSKLSMHTAHALGFDFNPQAAIVNYYHLDSTLSGHTDHSELNHNAPLLSFSFGRKAIFMIGGVSKCTYPTSIFVRSGDIIIMSEESRLSYHAVPKIFCKANDETNSWDDDIASNVDWDFHDKYLNESRINMNVRQVF